ncbi:eukaryotic cytochrome b561 domain-containing protein [Ditylenchus destructor]|uniref:ascorbate ferrireductase (transmembrane) n=1 Tax=Ditylenchus destructor TaxID=166010 RepID=A0AAD4RB81_9BILA|nr:eukaryotic cytochrome b561 domain-containing protein [Ditylenchus destructor]
MSGRRIAKITPSSAKSIVFRTSGLMQRAILLAYVFLCAIQNTHAAFDATECSVTKNCVQSPNGCVKGNDVAVCEYLFSYTPDPENEKHLLVELHTKRKPSVSYVSVGYSTDGEMGGDSVTHCAISGGSNIEAHLSQNVGKSNVNDGAPEAERDTLELLASEAADDHIYCKFRQKSTQNSNNLMMPDLESKPLYIFLVRGPASDPKNIEPHSFDISSPDFPFISPSLSLFSKPKGENLKALSDKPEETSKSNKLAEDTETGTGLFNLKRETKYFLIKFHGILMIVAWFACVTVAVYSARYLRDHWPNTTPGGLKIWFHIHRTLNVIAVVLAVTAGMLIWIAKDIKWTGPWFTKSYDENIDLGSIHSLVGLLATVFAVSQPFVALLRCGHDHPKRQIFNITHRTIGLAGLFLACVAILLAAIKFKFIWYNHDQSLHLILVVVFFVLIALLVVASELIRRKSLQQHQRVTAIEMQSRNKGPKPTPSDTYYYQTQKHASSKNTIFTKVLFSLAVLICVGTTILLALLIFQ